MSRAGARPYDRDCHIARTWLLLIAVCGCGREGHHPTPAAPPLPSPRAPVAPAPAARPAFRPCVSPETLQPSFSVERLLYRPTRFGDDILELDPDGHLLRIAGATGKVLDRGVAPVSIWTNSSIVRLSERALLVLPSPEARSVVAIDAQDAHALWTVTFAPKLWAIEAAVGGRTVYVVTAVRSHSGGELYAIEIEGGRVLWKVDLGAQFGIKGTPSADADGVVLWGTPDFDSDSLVMRSFGTDGTLRWSYRPSWMAHIAASGRRIVVATPYEGIRELARADGSEGLRANLPGVDFSKIVVRDEVVYYEGQSSPTEAPLTGAVDMSTAMPLWQRGDSGISDLQMADCSGVYGTSVDGDAIALARDTGATIWTWSFGRSVQLSPGPGDDSLLVVGAASASVFRRGAAVPPLETATVRGRVRHVECGKVARQGLSICGKLVRTDLRGRFKETCTARGTIGIYDEPEGLVPAPGPVALVPFTGAHNYRREFALNHCINAE